MYVDNIRYNFLGHRVVAEHFIPNPDNLPLINHDNTIKWDNRKSNLGWCTHSENMLHAIANGRMDNVVQVKGENHPNTKLTNEEVKYIKQNYVKRKNNDELYNMFSNKIGRSAFDKICYGSTWKQSL